MQTDAGVGMVHIFDGPRAQCPRVVMFPVTKTHWNDIEKPGEKFEYLDPPKDDAGLRTLVHAATLRRLVHDVRSASTVNHHDAHLM